MKREPCPVTAWALDGPCPYECACILERWHGGDCRCQHGFKMPAWTVAFGARASLAPAMDSLARHDPRMPKTKPLFPPGRRTQQTFTATDAEAAAMMAFLKELRLAMKSKEQLQLVINPHVARGARGLSLTILPNGSGYELDIDENGAHRR